MFAQAEKSLESLDQELVAKWRHYLALKAKVCREAHESRFHLDSCIGFVEEMVEPDEEIGGWGTPSRAVP